MNSMSRLLFCLFALSASAGSSADVPSNALLRAANEAIRHKNVTGAVKLLSDCEERSTDPGLIAFNRGVMFFEAEEFREAELNFLRCLEDQAIPTERRTLALYNRGVSLVRRGEDEKALRAAVTCFEQCLDAAAADSPLSKDARHNLELTKLLWNQARAKQATPPTPNDRSEELLPRTQESTIDDMGPTPSGTEQTPGSPMAVPNSQQVQPQPSPMTQANAAQQVPGRTTLPVIDGNANNIQKLSPDDTNALLDLAEGRLQKARKRNEQMRAGPERPNVRDW